MVGRWVAISLIIGVLVLVGVMAGAVFLGRGSSSPSATSSVPQLGKEAENFSGTAGPWSIGAQVARGGATELAVVINVANAQGEPADQATEITAALEMMDMSMGGQPVPLTSGGPGQWLGVGQVQMTGRWMLRITVSGDSVEFPFATTAP